MLNIEVPVSVGEKVYFYSVFNNKLFVMSASVAEIDTITAKNGTDWLLKTNSGRTFFGNRQNEMFFLDEESAVAEAEKRIADVNAANIKIGRGDVKVSYGGVI